MNQMRSISGLLLCCLVLSIQCVLGNEDFIKAVKSNNFNMVEELIISGEVELDEILTTQTDYGAIEGTPMMIVAALGTVGMVNLLQENGGQPNGTFEGSLPLHQAALHGNKDVLQLLIQTYHSCPIEYSGQNTSIYMPLHLAILNGHLPIVEYLVELNPETVNSLSDPYRPDSSESPLMIAFAQHTQENPSTEIIQYLLNNGANPNITNNSGQTLLHLVCEQGDIELAQLLALSPGFNTGTIMKEGINGFTPLQLASISSEELYGFLLANFQVTYESGEEETHHDLPQPPQIEVGSSSSSSSSSTSNYSSDNKDVNQEPLLSSGTPNISSVATGDEGLLAASVTGVLATEAACNK